MPLKSDTTSEYWLDGIAGDICSEWRRGGTGTEPYRMTTSTPNNFHATIEVITYLWCIQRPLT